MLKKLAIVLLALSFVVVGFGKEDPTAYSNYDLAPGAIPKITPQTDPQWDLLYSWPDIEAQSGDNGIVGICFDGTSIWISGRGVTSANMVYLFDPATGAMTGSFPTGTTSAWGCRDWCTDGTFLYGGEDGGLRVFDPVAQVMVSTIPFPGGFSFQRANAYNPATDHFFCGNFGSTCYEQDRNGNMIRSWPPAPLTAVYGMAWDADADDGPWLWVHDQLNPVSGCNVHQLDPVTLTYTGFNITLDVPPAPADMAGGLHYCSGIDPIYTTMLVLNQGTPDCAAAFEMHLDTPPTAPAAPTDFVLADNGPDLIATLSWVNPTLTVGGDPLTDLIGMKVERDGVVIEDITPATAGAAMEYFDFTVPAAGMYGYMVYGYNADDGAPVSGNIWIGPDVPGLCGNFDVVPDALGDLFATASWDAPLGGAHGGYFPGTDTYNLYRAPMNQPLVMVADMITGTSFLDEVPFQGWYDYAAAGVNGSGVGMMTDIVTIYIGPPEFEEIPYDWFEINQIGTNTGISGDDQNLGPFDMGIAFPWYDNAVHSSVRICSNGWISFTSTSTTWTNAAIPSTGLPNDLVAPYWDDLNPSGNYYGEYYTWGDDERFIVEFDSVNFYLTASGDWVTCQAIFYPDGTIDFQYKAVEPGTLTTFPSATVGIENSTGTVGLQLTYNGSGPWEPTTMSGVRIHPVGFIPEYVVDMVLTPVGMPIVIPAGGGDFDFNIAGTNLEPITIITDVWTNVTLPSGAIFGPIINISGFSMPSMVTIDRDRTQAVPAGAPPGEYVYNAYAGFYPTVIFGEDHFDFSKATDGDGMDFGDWYCWGEAFPGEVVTAPDMPTSYTLMNAYPNPFNPIAHIGYTLPARAQVELVVYDITGREVATLVSQWVEAGSHSVTFDAQGLASGVYFYRLNAGEFSSVKKMILMK